MRNRSMVSHLLLVMSLLISGWLFITNVKHTAKEQRRILFRNSIRHNASCPADCLSEAVDDIWTGGEFVVFRYSAPLESPILLLEVFRLNFDGTRAQLMADQKWITRLDETMHKRLPSPKIPIHSVPYGSKSA